MEQNMNWDRIDQIGQKVQSTTKTNTISGTDTRSIFAKFKAGMHRIRIIPVGNKLENLPFMELGQHSMKIPYQDQATGRITYPTVFCMCWQFIYKNFLAQETMEAKRNNSILGYLTQSGKLSEEESAKFQQYGCPFCKAHEHGERMAMPKEDRNKMFTKYQFIWNILWKFDPMLGSGDNKIYVWGISTAHFNTIISTMRRDRAQGVYTIDAQNGYDITWNAKGEGMSRRYDSPAFERQPSVLELGGQTPYDLAEIMANSFKPYQEVVNLLKKGMGATLQQYGYIIPGDLTQNVQYTQPAPSPSPFAVPVPQMPQEVMVPQPPVYQPQPVMPSANQMVQPFIPQPQATIPQVPASNGKEWLEGNTMYKLNGHLYRADGTLLF